MRGEVGHDRDEVGERGTTRAGLVGKLVAGFVFALVLQIAQMLISGYFTARMQQASTQVCDALSASLAVQSGIDAVRQLELRLAADAEAPSGRFDPSVYRVFLDEVSGQVVRLVQALGDRGGEGIELLRGRLGNAVRELEVLHGLDRDATGLGDALGFFDDRVRDVEQELLRTQIEVGAIAAAGVGQEREVHDLPLRAGVAITLIGVVLMAGFVAWFSQQLVVPIQRVWAQLESRVALRTAELANTVQQLEDQIVERRRAEAQREELHRQLVDASRRAGMAELANGVLHNVGNVLNSVNVSANLLLGKLRSSRVDGLSRAVQLLRQHDSELGTFLTTSEQGRKLPGYLEQLGKHLALERDAMVAETDDLSRRVDHMKEIVSRQQSYARVAGVTSLVRPSSLVGDVLQMHQLSFAELDIRVETCLGFDEECELDRTRVLQILMNLVANGKQALRDRPGGGRILRMETHEVQGHRVQFVVVDNGVGIAEGDLVRIFGHGFTTKRDGHGFGLHHSANAAAEMGGKLWAESAGPGHGAIFRLELPKVPSESETKVRETAGASA